MERSNHDGGIEGQDHLLPQEHQNRSWLLNAIDKRTLKPTKNRLPMLKKLKLKGSVKTYKTF